MQINANQCKVYQNFQVLDNQAVLHQSHRKKLHDKNISNKMEIHYRPKYIKKQIVQHPVSY